MGGELHVADLIRAEKVFVLSTLGRYLVCEGERRTGNIGSYGQFRDTVEG